MLEEVTAGMMAPAQGERVAPASSPVENHGQATGGGLSAAEIAALSTPQGWNGEATGIVSPATGGNVANGGNDARQTARDCDNSETSEVTVPSTIAVPTKPPAACKNSPPVVATNFSKPALPRFSRSGGAGSSCPQTQQQVSKKQRSSSGESTAPQLMNRVNPAARVPNPQAVQQQQRQQQQQQKLRCAQPRRQEVTCVVCQSPGADVRIRCGSGCAYHARCLDLNSVAARNGGGLPAHDVLPIAAPKAKPPTPRGLKGQVFVRACPRCAAPSNGLEILPLCFAEIDCARNDARAAFLGMGASLSVARSTIGAPAGVGGAQQVGAKRSHEDLTDLPSSAGLTSCGSMPAQLPTVLPSHSGTQPRRPVQCYDPAHPRTGRWTDEEIAFRDTLISHFLSGSLPLSNGLRLNDFLPSLLKSKQSRLAKKMKHAKLSTKYFYPKSGCVHAAGAARELSRLERDFVSSIPDPIERSEVKFHMGREWREHFAHRCAALGIVFDGTAWLGSVEDMERRLALEKERHRLMKRRFMMGKAMEKDCDPSTGNALERGVFVRSPSEESGRDEFELVVEKSVSNSAGSMSDKARSGSIVSCSDKETPPSVWSSNEPNFKHAAPFLAGIASYVERNSVPFEHADVWTPSYADPQGNFRLSFGGSVTMGVKLVTDTSAGTATSPTAPSSSGQNSLKRVPITPDTKLTLSLFGQYSEKFSFTPGCGLPGRIFQSGIPTWEQFVSEAPASQFERRGGAIQFGIKTAVGLPIDSPNVGRIVLVLYSKYDRPKDEGLVGRMMVDLKLLCPSPRWKLVVDVDSPLGLTSPGLAVASSLHHPPAPPVLNINAASRTSPVQSSTTVSEKFPRSVSTSSGTTINTQEQSNAQRSPALSHKDQQIKNLLLLLASNIPSDMNSPLGQQLNGIMSLRLVLLRANNCTPEEQGLVDTVLVLYESYLHAGRSEQDIAVMVARDFTFHLNHLGGAVAKSAGVANANSTQQSLSQHQVPPSMYQQAATRASAQFTSGSPLMGPLDAAMKCNSRNQFFSRSTASR